MIPSELCPRFEVIEEPVVGYQTFERFDGHSRGYLKKLLLEARPETVGVVKVFTP